MKQQFATTHCTQFYKTEKKLDRPLINQHVSMLLFYKNTRISNGYNIFTEGMFVTELSSNAGISF